MSHRIARLESTILRELSIIQMSAKDDSLKGGSFTAVKIAPDLSFAKVFVATSEDVLVKELNKASSYFRRELAAKLDTRKTPKISFVIDKSVIEGEKIDKLLETIKDTN